MKIEVHDSITDWFYRKNPLIDPPIIFPGNVIHASTLKFRSEGHLFAIVKQLNSSIYGQLISVTGNRWSDELLELSYHPPFESYGVPLYLMQKHVSEISDPLKGKKSS